MKDCNNQKADAVHSPPHGKPCSEERTFELTVMAEKEHLLGMPRKKSSSLKENLKKKIPEASGADTATDVEMEELSEHEAETSPKDVQPDIRSPKSREQKIREKNYEVKRKARENEERRERERAQDAELRKQAR